MRLKTCAVVTLFAVAALTSGCNRDPNIRKQRYLESGKRYQAEGKFRESAIQFLNALKVDRNFAEAHFELGQSYLHMGATDQALNEMERTVELRPDYVQARINLGGLLLAAGLPDQAAAQASAALQSDPKNADGHALLSEVAASRSDRAQALVEIERALALQPNRSAFHSALGVLLLADSLRAGEAEAQLLQALALDGKNAQARFALAGVLERRGDAAGAERQLQSEITASPADWQARSALADLYLRTGDKVQAEQVLRQAGNDLPENPDAASSLADYDLRSGQPDRAESDYKQLVHAHPKSVPLRLAYARVLIARNKFSEAETVAHELSTGNESQPEVAALNILLLAHAGKTDEAFELAQKSARINPDSNKLHDLLASMARSRGDMALAEANYGASASRNPRDLNAQRGLAELANHKSDAGALRLIAETTIANYPKLPDGYLWKAIAEGNSNQLEAAAADLSTAIKLDPGNDQAFMELGEVRLRQQKTAEATTLLLQALHLNPASRALATLVHMDLQSHQPAKAVARIQDQVARFPARADLQTLLSAAELANSNAPAALASAQKAMQMDPESSDALRAYTEAEMTLGDLDSPVQAWQVWSNRHPRDPQAPAMLGMLYEAAGDVQKAIDAYQTSLRLQPNQPVASNNLAYLLAENGGNLDEALSLAQEAQRALPNASTPSDTLAWIYFKKGAYGSALDLLQHAAGSDPGNASIQYHLGMTYSRLNRKADAVDHLRRAVTLASDSPVARDAERELARLG